MKRHARNLMFRLLRRSGLPALLRATVQRRQVTIVMLHDPEPEAAERALVYLKKHYNLIALRQFLEATQQGDATQLPPKPLIVTLDDGHAGNYALLPVFQKHGIPATIFLCSGVVGTRRRFWFRHPTPGIGKEAFKTLPNSERLERLAAFGFSPEREYDTAQALSKSQIEAMRPFVDFQAHTAFHPCLPYCDEVEAEREILDCKTTLERDFGLEVSALAFPNGDYSERDIALLKTAGYRCAITVDFGYNNLNSDLFRLKRLSIDDSDAPDAVAVKASGLWTLLLGLAGKRKWTRLTELHPQKI